MGHGAAVAEVTEKLARHFTHSRVLAGATKLSHDLSKSSIGGAESVNNQNLLEDSSSREDHGKRAAPNNFEKGSLLP